jgi:hypothetical protein
LLLTSITPFSDRKELLEFFDILDKLPRKGV